MRKIYIYLLLGAFALASGSYDESTYIPLDISDVKFESMSSFPSTEKIPVPHLDKIEPLQQKRKERNEQFLIRVKEATVIRQAETYPLQSAYRADVLRRNNIASSSKTDFDVLVQKYNVRLKKFRDFIDYDAQIHGALPVSQNYENLQNVNMVFDDSLQDPNLDDPYLPLITAFESRTFSSKNDDLRKLIRKTKKAHSDYNSWLFVVSIEKYKNTENVLFATRTSTAMVDAFQKKLGIPARHTTVLRDADATGANILASLEKMVKRIQPKDSVYFYFVGHAMAGPSGKNFMLAYDGSVDMMTRDGLIGMNRIYNTFQRSKASRTFAFIDASFNGITDGIPLKKGEKFNSPVKKTKYHKRINIINAAHRDQMSNAYFAKGYRLFSYYLIKGSLSEKKQDTGDMFDTLQTEIAKISKSYGPDFEQEPEFYGYRNLAMQK